MVKIEAVIQRFKVDEVIKILEELGVPDLAISEVLTHGTQQAQQGFYRGSSYRIGVRLTKIEVLAQADRADEIVDAIARAARTSISDDDGRILVYEIADAVRIRSGEHLQYTLA